MKKSLKPMIKPKRNQIKMKKKKEKDKRNEKK